MQGIGGGDVSLDPITLRFDVANEIVSLYFVAERSMKVQQNETSLSGVARYRL
ncbi:MAG: hypothetical protein ABJA67_10330 [Chthonomonadales bacterium]